MAFCEIDGWCRCCCWGPGDGHVFFLCLIDGRVLGSLQFGFLCRSYNIFGMLFGVLVEELFRCWRAIVARVSLFGVYGGVIFSFFFKRTPQPDS